jgi:hypothetical protein
MANLGFSAPPYAAIATTGVVNRPPRACGETSAESAAARAPRPASLRYRPNSSSILRAR